MPGEFAAWPKLRGGEVLDLLGSIHGGFDPTVRDELVERFEFDPSKKGREYSKGNRQKIALIAAFMVQPDLLVLDEPTSGLDPLMEQQFRACVEDARDRGQTVFLSSHILSEVEAVCDRVAILRSGRLVEVGTLDDLRKLNTREVEVEFASTPVPTSRRWRASSRWRSTAARSRCGSGVGRRRCSPRWRRTRWRRSTSGSRRSRRCS